MSKVKIGAGIVAQQVNMPASFMSTNWSKTAPNFPSNSLRMAREKQQRMAQMLGPLPPTEEPQIPIPNREPL